jgi:phenylacetate-CoA ligase
VPDHFDSLETRDPASREQSQFAALRRQVAHAQAASKAFARILAGVDAATVTSREALARLPVTRKSALLEIQKDDRPFGGLAATRWGAAPRVFASPGPIYEPEGARPDYWRLARSLFAAGFRAGDLIHNCFSYHFTPAGSMLETGAHALGCTVFPGGIGQTEQQVQAIAELRPDGYVGTPSFLRIILDNADERGVPLPSLTKALVSGEAFLPSMRDALAARGIHGYQAYASADLGAIAYETSAREGLVVDEGVIVEIVRPGTGDPVAPGDVGEVVVTSLYNTDYPLIRFGTGDLSALLPGISACGRTNMRIKGWMGRADTDAVDDDR